jgi:hypothetical protein
VIKISKHIAIVLWAVFTFPLVYQSLHYFEHHLNAHNIPDTCTESHFVSTHESCAVCDYEMALGDQPLVYHSGIEVVSFAISNFVWNVNCCSLQPVFYTSLRAPPGVS